MLCALGEARRAEAFQTDRNAIHIIGSDIEMHPILDPFWFRDALQDQWGMGRILRTKKKVRLYETDLVITERGCPEIGESFRILAIDDQIYV